MAENTAMLTARLPKEIKKAGNEMIESCGYTPSQAVQVIWEYFAHCTQAEANRAFKLFDESHNREKEERLKAFENSKKRVHTPEHYKKVYGFEPSADYEPLSSQELKELRQEYLWEKYTGRAS